MGPDLNSRLESHNGGPDTSLSEVTTMGSQAPQARKKNGDKEQNSSNSPAPLEDGRSPFLFFAFSQISRSGDASETDSDRCGENSADDGDGTSPQAAIRWGHCNFRSAKVLSLAPPEKVPFCEAWIEANSHPRRSHGSGGDD